MTTTASTPESPGAAGLLERLRTALSGRYAVEHEIGRGAMATVFLARDLKHDRQVAIKVLADDLSTTIGATRFLREIQVAAQLLHPNILGLIDSGEAQGSLYYIMPYVRGETLRDKLRREKRLSVGEALRIAREVTSALEHAHEYGIIHRDIKPENILLVNGQHAAVADFGLARAVFNASTLDRTSTGMVVGSPYYMSPEQATGEQDLDGRTDIYSLGCVMFEMLTGGPPFHGKTVQSVLTQQLTAPAPRVRSRRADLSAEIDAIVQRALAKEPAQRYQSARELTQALSQLSSATYHSRAPVAWNWLASRQAIVIPAVLAIGLATVLLGRYGGEVRNRATVLMGAQLDTMRYAVLPFRRAANVDGDAEVEQLMHDALHRWNGVQVTDQFQVHSRIADPAGLSPTAAKAAALHFRAGRFVWGDIARRGDSITVRATVYDTRSGRALSERTVKAAVGSNISAPIWELADALLFRGAVDPGRTEVGRGTTSYLAYQANLVGHGALKEWNLRKADSAFSAAIKHDPNYASANLWLGQVRGWLSDNPADWRLIAERAFTGRSQLPERDQQLARALFLLTKNDYPQACGIYRQLKAVDPTDFIAAYGIGECNRRDSVVVSDPASRTGYSFRSSYHEAAQSYRDAFERIPAIHTTFQGQAFSRVRNLIYTASNYRRTGRIQNDTMHFWAAPEWQGDTLAFVPFPSAQEAAQPGRLRSPTTVTAVNHQRELFYQIAKSWRAAYPNSAETMQAIAVALELRGDSTALDSLRVARRMADNKRLRARLAANEVLLRIKLGTPDNPAMLMVARELADSVLRDNPEPDAGDADLLASVSAVTGRAHLAATLSRRTALSSPLVGLRTVATSRALLAYAALGAPLDSIRALEARVTSDVRNTVAAAQQGSLLSSLLGQAAATGFSAYRFPALEQVAGGPNQIANLEYAYARGDVAKARSILTMQARQRAVRRPSDFTLDMTYAATYVVAEIDGAAEALKWLDPVLNAAQMYPPENMGRVANAGSFMRALLLRAELARRSGDAAGAARWTRPVDILWKNADPGIRQEIERTHTRIAAKGSTP